MIINPLDREALRQQCRSASPFPFVKIDNFLNPAFAREVSAAYPAFDIALERGHLFKTVNERKKVQISDSRLFPESVEKLHKALSSADLLTELSYVMGIPNLLADEKLVGGGIHVTGPGGRLDVHVDFNFIEERKLHRRLNLLLYLNPSWEDSWGGQLQLWDNHVSHCEATFAPIFNRCVIFETNEVSYHGVVPISPAAPTPRKS